jgi:hypothetical protein
MAAPFFSKRMQVLVGKDLPINDPVFPVRTDMKTSLRALLLSTLLLPSTLFSAAIISASD